MYSKHVLVSVQHHFLFLSFSFFVMLFDVLRPASILMLFVFIVLLFWAGGGRAYLHDHLLFWSFSTCCLLLGISPPASFFFVLPLERSLNRHI